LTFEEAVIGIGKIILWGLAVASMIKYLW